MPQFWTLKDALRSKPVRETDEERKGSRKQEKQLKLEQKQARKQELQAYEDLQRQTNPHYMLEKVTKTEWCGFRRRTSLTPANPSEFARRHQHSQSEDPWKKDEVDVASKSSTERENGSLGEKSVKEGAGIVTVNLSI